MLDTLRDPRKNAPDLLQRVYDGTLKIRELYGAYVSDDLEAVRRAENDPDLSSHLPAWRTWLTGRVRKPIKERQADDYARQVGTLVTEGFRLSDMKKRTIEGWLTKQGKSESTRARYFAALRSFVDYLAKHEVITNDPLFPVEVPTSGPARDKYLIHEDVLKILSHMSGEYQALAALAFGSGMERTALLKTNESEGLKVIHVVDAKARVIRAPGTKAVTRDRYVIVDEWAWPYVERQVNGKAKTANMFTLDYEAFLDAFYGAQIDAGLVEPLPDGITPRNAGKKSVSIRGLFHTLHDCRHTWAVTRLTGGDGGPVGDLQFIADQLGHSDLQMVSRIYAKHRSRTQALAAQKYAGI
jgi:integrase